MSMLAYYSKSNEQCRELFLLSKLGQRDKAQRRRYLDYMLTKCRAKEAPPVNFDQLKSYAENIDQTNGNSERRTSAGANPESGKKKAPPPPTKTIAAIPPPPSQRPRADDRLAYPPGFVGELARYFHASAIRPVPEIALVSALALVAGVVGRSYNISGTGLNLYLILLANTGSGKEEAARSIDRIIAAARTKVPMADRFVGPAVFASGQALVRVLDTKPCFVSVLGEFGVTLQQLCDPRAPGPTMMLKKVLLDLYSKGGFNQILRESVYSDHEKNTKIIQAPNVTILGESTPDIFYGGLDSSHILEGLVPRFSIVEYNGPRPARNHNAFTPPPESLIDQLADLLAIALTTQQNNTFSAVPIDPGAQALLDSLDKKADGIINGTDSDVDRHLWNRAHLKALKLSALIAVGCNPREPVVTTEHAQWAIAFVEREVGSVAAKYRSGEVGGGENKQESELKLAVRDYLMMQPAGRENYKVPSVLLTEPFIPYGYLRRRLRGVQSFKNDRRGPTVALQALLDSLVKSEELVLVNPRETAERWRLSTAVYAVGATFHARA